MYLKNLEFVESIYKFYQDTGIRLSHILPSEICDNIKFNYFKDVYFKSDGFTITFEIMVKSRVTEYDDFGLVFSIHAQSNSHYSDSNIFFNQGLYLSIDLGTTDGEIIDEIDELNFLPYNSENVRSTSLIVEAFIASKINEILPIMLRRYPELSQKSENSNEVII